MKRRYHRPADPKEVEHLDKFYSVAEAMDINAIFRCKHGVDKGERRCDACEKEIQARLDEKEKEHSE